MSMLGISRLKTRIGSTMTTSRYDTESPSNSPQPSPIQAPADANMQHEKAEAPRLHSRTTCSRNYDAPLRSTEVDNKLAASALPPASTVTPYGAPARANRPRAVSPDQRPEFLTGMIGLMNSIQDVFARLPPDARMDVDLPQVAVIGSQSSGKSSVLESLVGKDFLPRNKDICTRRPLLLQLQQTGRGSHADGFWAEFLHQEGKKYTNFDDVRREIEAETNRTVGTKGKVSAEPITLKIYSPHVLSMTLIDLPGITKVPVGEQPRNIEEIITSITKTYIENEACIILAVTPGNGDVANSDAIKLAQQADPDGIRTLGVLTKVDIMDAGTDVRGYLLGEKCPKLKLGYVAVVNRSQADINSEVTVATALRAEQDWFENSAKGRPAYSDIAAGTCGTRVLALKINSLLKSHIQRLMPKLADNLRSQERRLKLEAEELGKFDLSSPDAAAAVVRRAVVHFEREVGAAISGDTHGTRAHLYGGARIANQLAMFSDHLRSSLPKLIPYTDIEIFQAVRNVYGADGQLLMADKAFRHLLPPLVFKMEAACQELVGFIFDELKIICVDALQRVDALKHFPALSDRINEVAALCLKDACQPTREMVSDLIAMEGNFINTKHPLFIGGQAALIKGMELVDLREKGNKGRDKDKGSKQSLQPDFPQGFPIGDDGRLMVPRQARVVDAEAPVAKDDKLKVEITRVCLESYMEVVIGNLQDSIPKAIMLKLVNSVRKEKLSEYLNIHVNRPDMVEDLVQEDPTQLHNRKKCKAQLDAVSQAIRMLEQVPERIRHSTAEMRRSFMPQ